MDVYQTSDRERFLAHRPPGARIRVVRMPSVQIVRRNGQIEKAPAISLTYSFWRGDQQWVFEELRIANENETRVDLRDTLWAELDRDGDYQLVHRSGSF
jgi:hypothetical protein